MFLNPYQSSVRPHLEYVTSIWPSVNKKDTISTEKLKRRATKLSTVLRDLNYLERLKALGLRTLACNAARGHSLELCKSIKIKT